MKSETKIAKEELKSLLSCCTDKQQLVFKRMYSHQNIYLSINDVVDNMDIKKIDWAISQVKRTILKTAAKYNL